MFVRHVNPFRYSMKHGVLICALLLTSPLVGWAQTPGDTPQPPSVSEAEIRTQVGAFSEAFVNADADALAALLTDDYIHTNTGGGVLGKAAWLNWIRSRREELEAGTITITSYVNDDIQVKTYGPVAIVTGRNVTKGEREGVSFCSALRFTHVWVTQGGQARRAAFHDTRIEDALACVE